MAKTFRQALLENLARTGQSLRSVADGSDVSYEQLKKLHQRESASTNVDDARKIATFFGLTLDEFLEDSLAEDRLRVAKLWLESTEAEREILRAAARGRDVHSQ